MKLWTEMSKYVTSSLTLKFSKLLTIYFFCSQMRCTSMFRPGPLLTEVYTNDRNFVCNMLYYFILLTLPTYVMEIKTFNDDKIESTLNHQFV